MKAEKRFRIYACSKSVRAIERLGCIDEEKENQLLEIHQTEPDIFHLRSDSDVDGSSR